MEKENKWAEWLNYVETKVPTNEFKRWFTPIKLQKMQSKEGVMHLWICFPNNVFFDYIKKEHAALLRESFEVVFGKGTNVFFSIGEEEKKEEQKEKKATLPDFDSQLNGEYTFDNFIEGESNKLTRSVGVSIAKYPEKSTFSPFFIFGPSGVGKTHLANAIGLLAKQLHPNLRVLMVSTNIFTLQYTEAVRKNKFNDFLFFYMSIDILIIDDVQEMASKKGTLEQFFHIFNHLHLNHKTIIMTCDRPPHSLEGMEDRMLSRFKWNMVSEIERPNIQLRRAILKAKLRTSGLSLPQDVIECIAEKVSDNVRELEGIVSSMLAITIVENCEIDLPLALRVISRSVNLERKDFTVEDIICHVCQQCGVNPKEVASASRKRPVVYARQLSMFLCQKYTGLSLSQIGLKIGKRDHSTVIYSCNLVEKRMGVDKEFRRNVEAVESTLKRH